MCCNRILDSLVIVKPQPAVVSNSLPYSGIVITAIICFTVIILGLMVWKIVSGMKKDNVKSDNPKDDRWEQMYSDLLEKKLDFLKERSRTESKYKDDDKAKQYLECLDIELDDVKTKIDLPKTSSQATVNMGKSTNE